MSALFKICKCIRDNKIDFACFSLYILYGFSLGIFNIIKMEDVMPTRKNYLTGAAFLLGLLQVFQSVACTGVFTKAKDGGVVYARSLEFAVNVESKLAVCPKGMSFTGVTPDGENGLEWKGQYGFVGMNVYGKPLILDGINEKGLLFGAFYFPGEFYLPPFDSAKAEKSLAPMQLGVWALSQFATVGEVKRHLEEIVFAPTILKEMGICPPLHFMIVDANGDAIVVEPTKDGVKVYDNTVHVMTNSPTFDWHLTNLRQYMKLSNKNASSKELGKLKLTQIGNGSGMFGVPGDITPPSRFVRAAFYLNQLPEQPDVDQALATVMRLLKYFYITKGMVVEPDGKTSLDEYTMWETYADLKNKRFYFATYDNMNIRMVDLKKLNLESGGMIQFDINQPQIFQDVTTLIK